MIPESPTEMVITSGVFHLATEKQNYKQMKKIFLLPILFLSLALKGQALRDQSADPSSYLNDLKNEMKIEWPKNRTINVVFHGHSVPAGYFKTPVVRTIDAYPYQFLKKLKEKYPFAVVNVIVTAIGGENSLKGAARFKNDVLLHRPDILFIDYVLNDRGPPGLEKAYKAWSKMIGLAKKNGIKVILLTPSPDQRVNYADPSNELKQHRDQIIQLAKRYQVGLVDCYKVFEFAYADKGQLERFMSQVNHPNEAGHALIANEIMKWF